MCYTKTKWYMAYQIILFLMTLIGLHLLQALSNAIICTVMQQLTRFRLPAHCTALCDNRVFCHMRCFCLLVRLLLAKVICWRGADSNWQVSLLVYLRHKVSHCSNNRSNWSSAVGLPTLSMNSGLITLPGKLVYLLVHAYNMHPLCGRGNNDWNCVFYASKFN